MSTVEELGNGRTTRIGVQLVRLPVALTGCDRRWLMPVATDATPSFARRFPQATLAFNLVPPGHGNVMQLSGDASDEYDDLQSAVS